MTIGQFEPNTIGCTVGEQRQLRHREQVHGQRQLGSCIVCRIDCVNGQQFEFVSDISSYIRTHLRHSQGQSHVFIGA
jgi:hypothetical protein